MTYRDIETTLGISGICIHSILHEHLTVKKTNRRRRITLHHDNASSHISAQTIAFLNTQNIDLISHPPYNPDLAPNDLFLFSYVKNKMRGQLFSTPEKVVDAFRIDVLEDLNQSGKSASTIGSNPCKSV